MRVLRLVAPTQVALNGARTTYHRFSLPVTVTDGPMYADDDDSGRETVYLLGSRENARRLMAAVARDRAVVPGWRALLSRWPNSRRWSAARSELRS